MPDWGPFEPPKTPDGALSVVYIVLDDVGFSAMSWHGDCRPSRQACRGGAIAAVTTSPPWRPGRTAPVSFGGVPVTAIDRRKLSARVG